MKSDKTLSELSDEFNRKLRNEKWPNAVEAAYRKFGSKMTKAERAERAKLFRLGLHLIYGKP